MSSEELDKLYADKGKLITEIEVGQARLQAVNKRIVELLNSQTSPE